MTVFDLVCSLVFERISLIVFHVFLISFLKRLKHNSKYVCFAVRMLLFKIPLYVNQALTLGLWMQWPGGPVDLKTYWPPKKLTGPFPKTKLVRGKKYLRKRTI